MINKSMFSVLTATLLVSCMVYAAVPAGKTSAATQKSSEVNPQVYEKLTGKKFSKVGKKKKSSPARALALARESRQNGDYVLALKRYNFVMKYYPRSAEAKMAVQDKAAMYSQMGLKAPSEHNQKILQTLEARKKRSAASSMKKSENKLAPKKQSKVVKPNTVKR